MQQYIIRSAAFFQSDLYANARDMTPKLSETLLLLSIGHLFRFYNPNQVAAALGISKNRGYQDLKAMGLYQCTKAFRNACMKVLPQDLGIATICK